MLSVKLLKCLLSLVKQSLRALGCHRASRQARNITLELLQAPHQLAHVDHEGRLADERRRQCGPLFDHQRRGLQHCIHGFDEAFGP